MIDAQRVNIIIILIFLSLLFLPLYAISAFLAAIAFLLIGICCLKLFAIFTKNPKKVKPKKITTEPFVSIIVACANEPYQLVSQTLEAMGRLNYSSFEVLVIDNNNENELNWKEIQNICSNLGSKFHFFHIDHVDGYKAGALNYANKLLDSRSEIIAIVDSDYIVAPNFLKEMAAYFADKSVAIVQAPQDYYDHEVNPGLYCNYRSFFSTYMNQAQKFNTVTFTGTMGMIRRQLFSEGLKWNEWCITEDTEAGMFIHGLGYKGIYIDKPYGQGIMPLSYQSLIKQRSRWSYGNMQIIRKNLLSIFCSRNFTFLQKIGFITQLVAWIRFDLALSLILLASILRQTFAPSSWNVLNVEVAIMLLIITLIVELIFFIWGLDWKFPLSIKLKGLLVHYGLLFTMSYSWIYQILGGRLGFLVTDKIKKMSGVAQMPYFQELTIPVILSFTMLLMIFGSTPSWLVLTLGALISIEILGGIYLTRHFRRIQ